MTQKTKGLISFVHHANRRLQLVEVPGQFPALTQQKVFRALISVVSLCTCVRSAFRRTRQGESIKINLCQILTILLKSSVSARVSLKVYVKV